MVGSKKAYMRYLSLLLASTCLFACHSRNTAEKPKEIQLQLSSLYNKDTVLLVARHTAGKNKDADKMFLDAIDTYRNKKNPAGGVALFKRSILLQPTGKAYYELGNALMDQKEYLEATNAYTIAELMDYSPLYKVMYNQACAYSQLDYKDKALYYLTSAIEFGYSNLKNIYNDPDLKNVRVQYRWKFDATVKAAFSGATDPEKLEWNLFYHEFRQLEFPLVLDMQYSDKLGDQISYDYERYVAEMRDATFSRDVGSEYYYVGIVRSTDSVKAVIYAEKDVMTYENISPVYYMVSYNPYGKLIDKLQIGGHKILKDPFKVPTVHENGNIQITLFQLVYAKDPEEHGLYDNRLLESKELEKEFYSLSDDGHFVKQSALLGMR
jgi:hypothetical protein